MSKLPIFISWSGPRSGEVAKLLRTWIPRVLQATEPWYSADDIHRGALWFEKINEEIGRVQNSIICLTKDNINAPWILFECGALARADSDNRVCTFLVDLETGDVKSPLSQLNSTLPNKDSVLKLMSTFNSRMGALQLADDVLKQAVEVNWPYFADEFDRILSTSPSQNVASRPTESKIDEILETVRSMERRFIQVEAEPVRRNKMVHEGISSLQSHLGIGEKIGARVTIDNYREILPGQILLNDTFGRVHFNRIRHDATHGDIIAVTDRDGRSRLFLPGIAILHLLIPKSAEESEASGVDFGS